MRYVFAICVLLWLPSLAASAEPPAARLVEARKIWSEAPHNAFTDLIRFKDRWYCVFREGKAHVSPDGALRVITSLDGEKWESVALVTSKTGDLRDAKITITPDGELMLSGAEALNNPQKKRHQSLCWFSKDGRTWSEGAHVGDADFWLWRVTWHKGKAYGIGYNTNPKRDERTIRLYASLGGRKFQTLKDDFAVQGSPNESSLLFTDDDICYCLLRRETNPNTGLVGTSKPPYIDWTWKDLGARIGGPHWIRLPEEGVTGGRYVAVVRLYDGGPRTALCWIDPTTGKFNAFLKLPSGGDTSYAGLIWHEGLLWISYYASHEGKTSIYLAKVKFE